MEIETQWRLRISYLTPIFRNLRKLSEYAKEQIAEQPSLSEEEQIELRRELIKRNSRALSGKCDFRDGLIIHFEAEVDFIEESLPVDYIFFKWEYMGAKYCQRVRVTAKPSNLGLRAPVYYFVCPYSRTLSLKLYTDGRVLSGRRGFEHLYRKQTYSKSFRLLAKLLEIGSEVEKSKNRKEFYRGKITPYGRKLRKELLLYTSLGLTRAEFWERFTRRQGRPPKGLQSRGFRTPS